MINRGLLFLCAYAAWARCADAQPREHGKDFFERDYARGIQHDAQGGFAKQKTPQPVTTPERSQAGSSAGARQSSAQMATVSASSVSSQEKPQGNTRPDDIPRVELYVNSADANHLNQVVVKALELRRKGKIFLIGISHIGDYRTLSPEARDELAKLQIRYTAAPSVLYGEHIKLSPTWAFVSPEGARLVEGCLDPERYISTNGAEPATTKLDAMNKEEGNLAGL